MMDDNSDILSSVPDTLPTELRSFAASEANSIADEAVADSDYLPSSPSQIRLRMTVSGVWNWGHKKIVHGIVQRHGRNAIWQCDACNKELSNTGAAKQHLWHIHGISVDGFSGQRAATSSKRRRIEGPGSIEAGFARSLSASTELRTRYDDELLFNIVNQQKLHDCIVKLLVTHNLPHRAVEWPELKNLLMCINPMVEEKWVRSRAAAPKLIQEAYDHHKKTLKDILQTCETQIHISFDIWTSPNYKSLMGIVAHFVDIEALKLRKVLLALPEVSNHLGDTMATTFLNVLQDYGISRQLGFVCADNATANDKALRLLSLQLVEQEDADEWCPLLHRIRCLGHILNLAVQAFLFAKDESAVNEAERQLNQEGNIVDFEDVFGPHIPGVQDGFARVTPALVKLHNIQTHTRRSTQHYNRFVAIAGRSLPADNVTRWNSWYSMCNCACEEYMRPAITQYVEEYRELEDDRLTYSDWEILHDTRNFLLPFDIASRRLQGDNVTLDEVLWTMDVIVKHYETEKARALNKPGFMIAIITSWYAFDKWYAKTSDTPVYAAALLLHPSRRRRYIRDNWRRDWIQPALNAVEQLWASRYRDRNVRMDGAERNHSVLVQEPDAFDRAARLLQVNIENNDELDTFINQAPTRLPADVTALEWWLHPERRQEWPRLSYMAIEVLSIPGLSDEPERIFSGGRRTCRWDRASLSAASIERAEFLKSIQRSGIVSGDSIIA